MLKYSQNASSLDPEQYVKLTRGDGSIEYVQAKNLPQGVSVTPLGAKASPAATASPVKYVFKPNPQKPEGPKTLKDTLADSTGDDWLRWALAGGGGLLGYSLASNLMDNGKRNKSIWDKVLDLIVPLGVGGLGAYGAYRLGDYLGMKKAAADAPAAAQAPAQPDMTITSAHAQPNTIITRDNRPLRASDDYDKRVQKLQQQLLREFEKNHEQGETFGDWLKSGRNAKNIEAAAWSCGIPVGLFIGGKGVNLVRKGWEGIQADRDELGGRSRKSVRESARKASKARAATDDDILYAPRGTSKKTLDNKKQIANHYRAETEKYRRAGRYPIGSWANFAGGIGTSLFGLGTAGLSLANAASDFWGDEKQRYIDALNGLADEARDYEVRPQSVVGPRVDHEPKGTWQAVPQN